EEERALIMAKRAKGFPPLNQQVQANAARGVQKGKTIKQMRFDEVTPPDSNARAFFSKDGLTPQEMEELAIRMYGPDAEVVGGDGKFKSATEMARVLKGSAKRVVGAQSGKDLSVDDLAAIIKRQGLFRKEPHLIDLILNGGVFNPEMGPPLSSLHQAKKFIFDAEASEFIGTLLVKAQDQILEQHNWARPPFDVTWVEMDHAAYWTRGLGLPDKYPSPDNLFGFLVDHNTVWSYTYAPGTDHGKRKDTGCGPFQYQLHMPISFEDEMAMAQKFNFSLKQYRQALLGGMLDENGNPTIPEDWWQTVAGEVVRSHKMFLNKWTSDNADKLTSGQWQIVLSSSAGDLKLILTLLLMITRPRKMFAVSEVGPKRMLYKGHNLVRRSHSIVTMRLSKEKAMHKATTHEFTSQHRQMHDVRGHWAQSRTGVLCPGSEHEWEPIDNNHFYCLRCTAKRWWKKSHTRGELRLGDKTTDYTVTR
ncbi:MAG TPA: hypothetical protein VFI76_06325, partial [Terrimicrobiaceae bacterium]|nr:hypothetical protein [Terrimicrobiaceae bacterium]